MQMNMYVIDPEDLHWVIEAQRRLGKKYHSWLMVQWLKHHSIGALTALIYIGMGLYSIAGGEKLVKRAYEKYNTAEKEGRG